MCIDYSLHNPPPLALRSGSPGDYWGFTTAGRVSNQWSGITSGLGPRTPGPDFVLLFDVHLWGRADYT